MKALIITILLVLVLAFSGCVTEERIYLDIFSEVDINPLTTAGPLTDVRIYFTTYSRWTIHAEIKTNCDTIEIRAKGENLSEAFHKLRDKINCLHELCTEGE